MEQILVNSLANGSFYALSALSFNLLLGTVKFFDVSYGARVVFAAYLVFFLTKTLELNIFLAIFIGVAIAVLLAVATEKLIFLPLRKKRSSNLIMLLASFGVFVALGALMGVLFGPQFYTLSGGPISETVVGAWGTITILQICFIVLVPILFIALLIFLKKTSLGKAIRAVSDDEEVASISGINSNKVIIFVFILTTILGTLVTIFDLFDIGVDVALPFKIILKTIIVAIMGGVGSVRGGFIGGYILGATENSVAWFIGVEWIDAVAFLVLIGFLIFRPQGIFGKK